MSGSTGVNQLGNYGAMGEANITNIPGARSGQALWMDSNDILWAFGGHGYNDAGGPGRLNDLWKF